jgi:hypothetical protein
MIGSNTPKWKQKTIVALVTSGLALALAVEALAQSPAGVYMHRIQFSTRRGQSAQVEQTGRASRSVTPTASSPGKPAFGSLRGLLAAGPQPEPPVSPELLRSRTKRGPRAAGPQPEPPVKRGRGPGAGNRGLRRSRVNRPERSCRSTPVRRHPATGYGSRSIPVPWRTR